MKIFTIPTETGKYAIPLLIFITFFSRLPQLLSPNLYMDGDECIVGLMAKHFMEGKELPLFFYGQSYGFSFLEVLPISMFYALMGISILAVKLAMLLLFTIGIVFFYKALVRIGNRNTHWGAFLVTLLLVFSPTYAIWSMKARGGYLTAFMLTSVVMFLLFAPPKKQSIAPSIVTGLLLLIIYEAQPLWLAGLIPLLIYRDFQIKSFRSTLWRIIGLVLGIGVFSFLKRGLTHFWIPPKIGFSSIHFEWVKNIPENVFLAFTGSYDYTEYIEPDVITQLLSSITSYSIPVVFLIGIGVMANNRKLNGLFLVSSVSVLFSLGYLVVVDGSNPRYIIPLLGYVLLMIYSVAVMLKNNKFIPVAFTIVILMGAVSLYRFKDHVYYDNVSEQQLVQLMEAHDVEYLFSKGGLLQWKLMFYTEEEVVARYVTNTDRYPEYVEKVNQAYQQSDTNIALVGYYDEALVQSSDQFIPVNKSFYFYNNPPKELLLKLGFQLSEE